MSFAGLRGTGSWGTDERPKNFREMILWLNPNGKSPIFALMAKMAAESVDDPEFAWWEEQLYNVRVRVSVGLSSAAASTTVTLDAIDGANGTLGNALDLIPGDLLMVEQDPSQSTALNFEIMMVSTQPTAAGTIEVFRGARGTSRDGVADEGYLVKVGNFFEEGSASPNTTSKNPSKLTNYTQIFKNAFEVTDTAKETKARTGDILKNERLRKAFTHSADIEFSMLFGSGSEATELPGASGQPERTMKGLTRFCSTNVSTFTGGSLTVESFLDYLSPIYNNTADGVSNQRIAFCGQKFLNALNVAVYNDSGTQFQYNGKLNLFGMDLQNYSIPSGDIAFKTHPLLTQNDWLSGFCITIAPSAIRYRYLKNRDTKEMENIQNNDEDTQKNQWLSECSIEVHHESVHGFCHYKAS